MGFSRAINPNSSSRARLRGLGEVDGHGVV